jgi:hypothetical protein
VVEPRCKACRVYGPGECDRSRHGTGTCYEYHACRCADCKRAHSDRNATYYHTRAEADDAILEIRAKIKENMRLQGLAVASI